MAPGAMRAGYRLEGPRPQRATEAFGMIPEGG